MAERAAAAVTEETAADGNLMDGHVLLDAIKASTKELKDFCTQKKKGLKKQVTLDAVGPLIEVKEHLRSVGEHVLQHHVLGAGRCGQTDCLDLKEHRAQFREQQRASKPKI